jgi:hypothetical protein
MKTLGDVLYIGADDSNHKGIGGHEIVLATFSFFSGDEKYCDFKNRKNCRRPDRERAYVNARKWMKDTARDYRFASIDRERAVFDSNIPWVLPTLVKSYLEDCPYNVENLRIYIDGYLSKDGREDISSSLSHFPDMKIRAVIKKKVGKAKNKPRIIYCPKVLWGADIWANMIFQQSKEDPESILRHPNRIIIP